jgi:hypothetical protein
MAAAAAAGLAADPAARAAPASSRVDAPTAAALGKTNPAEADEDSAWLEEEPLAVEADAVVRAVLTNAVATGSVALRNVAPNRVVATGTTEFFSAAQALPPPLRLLA